MKINSHDKDLVASSNGVDANKVQRPTKNKKKRTIVIGIMLVVVAVFMSIGIALWSHLGRQSENTQSPTAALINDLVPLLKGSRMSVASVNNLGAADNNDYTIYSYAPYRVSNAHFKVLPLVGEGAGYVSDAMTSIANYKTLSDFFYTHHFRSLQSSSDSSNMLATIKEYTVTNSAIYESDNVVCSISRSDGSQTDLNNFVSSVGCADKDQYSKASEKLTPFYTAYTANNSTVFDDRIFGNVDITQMSNGYQNAFIYQEDASLSARGQQYYFDGLYYKKPGDKTWTYFDNNADTLVSCSNYASADLKKAFKGTDCYDQTKDEDKAVE